MTPTPDSSEAHQVAERHPDRVEDLKTLWLEEEKARNVRPLNDIDVHRGAGTQPT